MNNINPKKVQKMFDNISPKYDLLNRALSFRRDVRWRKKAIKKLAIQPSDTVLDLACGTGDMIVMMHKVSPQAYIIGGDFSNGMLAGAQKKTSAPLVAADATLLPFKDESFDKLTMTFGFRNVADKPKALAEIYRVLKPGGKMCILEFTKPQFKPFAILYWAYFDIVLPRIGRLISKHESAYSYLPESVKHFPEVPEYRAMIEKAGFKELSFTNYDLGICNVAIAVKG